MDKLIRKICYGLRLALPWRSVEPDAGAVIDVVIPVCEKDLYLLPLCLEGIRRNVRHRIAAIYVVAAESRRIREFCNAFGLVLVEETSVLGYGPEELNVRCSEPPYRDRSGWIFQQLLKLSGRIGTSPYFLTVDSDHLLLRPHTFVASDSRLVFYGSKECHRPYYRNIERLMGFYPESRLSYVAHKMIFSRSRLNELRAEIERRNGEMSWDRAIVASLDLREISGFSEFELFGNFVPATEKRVEPWRHRTLRYDSLADFDTLVRRFGRFAASITFPDYRSRGMVVPENMTRGWRDAETEK